MVQDKIIKTSILSGDSNQRSHKFCPYEITFYRKELKKLIQIEGLEIFINNAKKHIENTIREINNGK